MKIAYILSFLSEYHLQLFSLFLLFNTFCSFIDTFLSLKTYFSFIFFYKNKGIKCRDDFKVISAFAKNVIPYFWSQYKRKMYLWRMYLNEFVVRKILLADNYPIQKKRLYILKMMQKPYKLIISIIRTIEKTTKH